MIDPRFDEVFGVSQEKFKEKTPDITKMEAASTVPDIPEDEFEPPIESDPEAIPHPKDPFAAMIDGILETEGTDIELEKRRKYNPTSGDVTSHDWETTRESLFSGEKYQFRCKRCLKWLHVNREQTMIDAMKEYDIDPNCASQVIGDIQTA